MGSMIDRWGPGSWDGVGNDAGWCGGDMGRSSP